MRGDTSRTSWRKRTGSPLRKRSRSNPGCPVVNGPTTSLSTARRSGRISSGMAIRAHPRIRANNAAGGRSKSPATSPAISQRNPADPGEEAHSRTPDPGGRGPDHCGRTLELRGRTLELRGRTLDLLGQTPGGRVLREYEGRRMTRVRPQPRTRAAVVNGTTSCIRYPPASRSCASDSGPVVMRAASRAASAARSSSRGNRASDPVKGARSGSTRASVAYAAPATSAAAIHKWLRRLPPSPPPKRAERPVVAANTATGMIWPTMNGSLAANWERRSRPGQNAASTATYAT